MSKQDRATKIEKEKRLFIVQGWIIEGIQDNIIAKNIVERWGLDIRQAQRYVREAYEKWKKIEGVNIDMKREMKIAKLQQMIRTMKEEYKGTPAGISAIMAVEKEIIKLEGLEPAKTINLEMPQVEAVKFKVVYGKGDRD
jgi:hypothetical protein